MSDDKKANVQRPPQKRQGARIDEHRKGELANDGYPAEKPRSDKPKKPGQPIVQVKKSED